MTSDAKIGLLLGLVFIFIIAFVINGLPRFHNERNNDEPAIEENFVQGDPIGYGVRNTGVLEEQVVEEDIGNTASNNNVEPEYAVNHNPWSNDNTASQYSHADNDYYIPDYYQQESELTSDYSSWSIDEYEDNSIVADGSQDNERLRLDLPTSVSTTREVSLDSSNNRTEEQAANPPAATGYGWNRGFRQGGGFAQWNPRGQQGGNDPQGNPNPQFQANPPTPQHQVIPPPSQDRINPPAQTFQKKTYVIQEGDNNLAKIAKKLYGEQEGNRLVNINRIYEANKNILKSPDKIFIGQTLIIPQPAPPIESRPSDVLSGSMFQNVSSVGGTTRQNDTIWGNRRWYVVKEDDSLWKIAAEQLGKGTRYGEISKLNANLLADENKLKPGMKLLLPVK